MKVHLDTDFGGDIDDLCALALLLRWRGEVELTGVTTVAENGGRRAGYVRKTLALAGLPDIPVAAGADNAGAYYPMELGLPDEARYWPEPVPPSPNPLDEALELLHSSIRQGAVIIAIGPLTNLRLLDERYPGILKQARLFCMGGYVYPVRPGFPPWGNDFDFNLQIDVKSAGHVLRQAVLPTLTPLSVTVETALRRAHLPALRQSGPLGALIARQAEAFAQDEQMESRFGAVYPGVPDDIINFQHDPLAVAAALGWEDGLKIEALPLVIEEQEGLLCETIDPAAGKPVRVVTRVDGERFNQFWLDTILAQS